MNSKNTLSRLVWSEATFETAVIDLNVLSSTINKRTLKICYILYDRVVVIYDGDLEDLEEGEFLRRISTEDFAEIVSRENEDFDSPSEILDEERFHRDFGRIRDEIFSSLSATEIEIEETSVDAARFAAHSAEAISISIQVRGAVVYSEDLEEVLQDFLFSRGEDYTDDLRISSLERLKSVNISEKSAEYIKNLRSNSFELVKHLREFEDTNEVLERRSHILWRRRIISSISKAAVIVPVSLYFSKKNSILGIAVFAIGVIAKDWIPSILTKFLIEIYAIFNPLVEVFEKGD